MNPRSHRTVNLACSPIISALRSTSYSPRLDSTLLLLTLQDGRGVRAAARLLLPPGSWLPVRQQFDHSRFPPLVWEAGHPRTRFIWINHLIKNPQSQIIWRRLFSRHRQKKKRKPKNIIASHCVERPLFVFTLPLGLRQAGKGFWSFPPWAH